MMGTTKGTRERTVFYGINSEQGGDCTNPKGKEEGNPAYRTDRVRYLLASGRGRQNRAGVMGRVCGAPLTFPTFFFDSTICFLILHTTWEESLRWR